MQPAVVAAFAWLSAPGASEAQQPTWLREFGSFSDDSAMALAPGEGGGVFVAGETSGSLFGPILSSPDVFLARFDDAGNFLSGVQFGTMGIDTVFALSPDGAAGTFVAGYTGGSLGAPNAGGSDAWFARCDSAGNRLWVRQLGTPAWDGASGLAPDGQGGVFVAGGTGGVLAKPAPGGGDAWMARYDGTGRQLWLRQFGTASGDGIWAIARDGAGGVFAAGSTTGAFAGPHMGLLDSWIGRFDRDGNQVWARQLGTAASDWVQALCNDGNAGVFVGGGTYGALGGSNVGELDAWLARYGASGDQLAITQFGTRASDGAGAVAADGRGGAFVCGVTNGSLGAPNAGAADAWVAHVDGGLSITWIDQLGSPYHDQAATVASAGPDGALVAGWTLGDLAPGGGGNGDAWLACYDNCYPDCNADSLLTVADFACFQTKFVTADPYADCNADGVLTVQDFGCFQTKFVPGCP